MGRAQGLPGQPCMPRKVLIRASAGRCSAAAVRAFRTDATVPLGGWARSLAMMVVILFRNTCNSVLDGETRSDFDPCAREYGPLPVSVQHLHSIFLVLSNPFGWRGSLN